MDWYTWRGNELLLNVSVQARARRDEISGIQGGALRIRLTAPPVDGKANAHLLAYVAKQCGISKSAVTLVGGRSSRHKRLSLTLQSPILPGVLARFC